MMKALYIMLLCPLLNASEPSPKVAVIANKSVPIDTVKQSELLDYYTGDRSFWSDGTRVIVFDLKQKGDTREIFYDFLGASSTRIKSIWMKRMLSGDADPPDFLESEEVMVNKVASTPGAIGFVDESKVDGAVKVLIVIEKENK